MKVVISVSLQDTVVKQVDSVRGGVPRSAFIEHLITEGLKENGATN